MKNYIIILILSLTAIVFNRCSKETKSSDIILWNKPLIEIQYYITGKWRLQYSYGGYALQKYIDKYNSFMILDTNHIKISNDSAGIMVDSEINWVKSDIGSNDFTYLLSFTWPGYLWPEYYIVDQIKNDTLIIRQNVSDSYTFYYTKY